MVPWVGKRKCCLSRSSRRGVNTPDILMLSTWADTTTLHGRLMLTVLGGLAEFERDLIRARTSEGRERAKARGVKMGRPPKSMNSSACGARLVQLARSVDIDPILPGMRWPRTSCPLGSILRPITSFIRSRSQLSLTPEVGSRGTGSPARHAS
jgi:hypothetical protein